MSKPPDEPQFNISHNASRPGLVWVSIGSGMGAYNITPELAEEMALQLIDGAKAALQARGDAQ